MLSGGWGSQAAKRGSKRNEKWFGGIPRIAKGIQETDSLGWDELMGEETRDDRRGGVNMRAEGEGNKQWRPQSRANTAPRAS